MNLPAEFEEKLNDLTIEKRDYQLSAVSEIIEVLPDRSILLNYPYGTGKTIITLLSFLAIKMQKENAKFIFTSAREAAGLRCRQALEMGKKFGYIESLGYLYDPTGKGLSLRQKSKMYEASTVIFSPITSLMNDYFEIKTKLKINILENIDICVIDEATDVLARDMSGFRLSKYFEMLFKVREKGNKFPILGLTGTRDKHKANAILRLLGKETLMMQRLDLSPYETVTKIHNIRREDYIKIDKEISTQLTKPIETIQKILDPKLSRLEIIKLSYSGVLERLERLNQFPAKLGKYEVKDTEAKSSLAIAFRRLFKLSHSRLLLLESTPGEFLKYIEMDENKDIFKNILEPSKELITYRVDLPKYENPEEKVTRALVQPKIYTAIDIIHEHLFRGAHVLVFTRYLALGNYLARLLNNLGFPEVKYLSGQSTEDTRRIVLKNFDEGNVNVLIFTPLGGRGLNLEAADVVIHLDITTNIDDMIQRRERARGCIEYVLVLEETSEEGKIKDYKKLIGQDKEDEEGEKSTEETTEEITEE
ncbi:MAG: DEAD/DEAH box helicase family protein [Candidatus Heimdallarchaeota archaeon]|nr:DEAD/DEAH box helicase family protein [Candidatus Heimdallarchaeota archaeon]